MFEKALQDLVKGIRAARSNVSTYVSACIAECKAELRSSDPFVKTEAIRKLTFLQMLGFDMTWAAFSVLEIMSGARFFQKRVGFLAANQSFFGESQFDDVKIMCTNLFKRDFHSPNQYEVALAINCLANVVNEEVGRSLLGDVVLLMETARPYVKKKAVLSLYKLYVAYPQGLRLTFAKLAERLEDPDEDPSVVSAVVNVICELANKNPRNYIAMAPSFFRIMTTSSNNWMLIKVVKLFGSLVAVEPRLARKLLDPLTTIIENTAAKSLQYECIHTVTLALQYTKRADGSDAKAAPRVVQLCSRHLQSFVEDADQNLKYLGLVGFLELMRSHPRAVVQHQQLIVKCLEDDDVTIRARALELLSGMVTRRSLYDLVTHLLHHVSSARGQYREEVVCKIIFMCSRDKFSFLADFDWYLSVLDALCKLPVGDHSVVLANQLIDVAIRVPTVRRDAVAKMVRLLLSLDAKAPPKTKQSNSAAEVLRAAAWILGEYAAFIGREDEDEDEQDAFDTDFHRPILERLLDPRNVLLPSHVQRVFVQSAFKVLISALEGARADAARCQSYQVLVVDRIGIFLVSQDAEVQLRAKQLLKVLQHSGAMDAAPPTAAGAEAALVPTGSDAMMADAGAAGGAAPVANGGPGLLDLAGDAFDGLASAREGAPAGDMSMALLRLQSALPMLSALVAESILPVNAKAQRKVPLPEGLELDTPFGAAPLAPSPAREPSISHVNFSADPSFHDPPAAAAAPESPRAEEPVIAMLEGAGGGEEPPAGEAGGGRSGHSEASPFLLGKGASPRAEAAEDPFAEESSLVRRWRKKKREVVVVNTEDLMPAGALPDDDLLADAAGSGDGLSKVDITAPLRPEEQMPQAAPHRTVEAKKAKKKEKKAKKKRDKAPPPESPNLLLDLDVFATPSGPQGASEADFLSAAQAYDGGVDDAMLLLQGGALRATEGASVPRAALKGSGLKAIAKAVGAAVVERNGRDSALLGAAGRVASGTFHVFAMLKKGAGGAASVDVKSEDRAAAQAFCGAIVQAARAL